MRVPIYFCYFSKAEFNKSRAEHVSLPEERSVMEKNESRVLLIASAPQDTQHAISHLYVLRAEESIERVPIN